MDDDFALTAETDYPVPAPTGGLSMSTTTGKFAEALAKAQGEMAGAAKDATNPHFRNRYPTLASVVEACKPLAKYGIAVLQPVRADGARVTVRTLLLHSSGEWVAEDLTLTAGANTPQAIGSALTYGRRYGLAAMAGIAPTDETDDDGEAAEGRGSAPVLRQAPAPPPKPATPKPTGFDRWWDDLQAVADEGKDALELAWNKSAKDLRKYLTDHHLAEWQRVRAKALGSPV